MENKARYAAGCLGIVAFAAVILRAEWMASTLHTNRMPLHRALSAVTRYWPGVPTKQDLELAREEQEHDH